MPKETHSQSAEQSAPNHGETSPKNLKNHIEAILFWRGDPMTVAELAKFTAAAKEDVSAALEEVRNDLSSRGIVLIEHEGEYTLGTNPESARLIEAVRKEELSRELGKAGLETLAIVLYQGPVRRSEIDYIRGVNSNFILRNLLIRGLIERKPAPNDSRASVYSASMELIRHMGLSNISELPDFEIVKSQIADFKSADENAEEPPAAESTASSAPIENGEGETKPATEESASTH